MAILGGLGYVGLIGRPSRHLRISTLVPEFLFDTTPNAFGFVDVGSATPGAVIDSEWITISGIDNVTAYSLTGTGATVRKDSGGVVGSYGTSGTLVNGDKLQLRVTASLTAGANVDVVLTVGGVTDTWTVTTSASVTEWPYSFALTADVVGAGSSTMSGPFPPTPFNHIVTDTTGGTYGASAMSGTIAVGNYGAGGKTSTQVLATVQGMPTRAKAANAIFQLAGNYESGQLYLEDLIVANAQAMVGPTGLNHNRYLHVPKHNDGAGGNGGWDAHIIQSTIRALKAVSPEGSVDDASLIFQTYPVTDPGDIAAQIIDRVPPSLQGDTAHLNATGNQVLARYSYERWIDAIQGGLPFIPHQRVYSSASTNQTNNGIVCTVEHYSSVSGTLTGAVVDVAPGASDFKAAIEAGVIVVRRATSTLLLNAKYDIPIRVTKGGKSRVTTVRIYMGSLAPSGDYRTTINGDIMAKSRGIVGAVNGKNLHIALGIKVIGNEGTTRRLLKTGVGAAVGSLVIELKTTNRFSILLRDAANAQVANFDSSGVAGQVFSIANGMKWLFFSMDTSTGYGRIAVDDFAATTGTVVTDGVGVPAPVGIANSLATYFLGDAGNTFLNNCEIAALWASTDAGVDFGPTTGHRDIVRNAATKKCLLGPAGGIVNGAAPFLWLQGAGNIAAGVNLAAPNERFDTLNKSGMVNVAA